jgi:hypothetical protein
MLNVIGCGNVAAWPVWQSPLYQWPVWHPQLLS